MCQKNLNQINDKVLLNLEEKILSKMGSQQHEFSTIDSHNYPTLTNNNITSNSNVNNNQNNSNEYPQLRLFTFMDSKEGSACKQDRCLVRKPPYNENKFECKNKSGALICMIEQSRRKRQDFLNKIMKQSTKVVSKKKVQNKVNKSTNAQKISALTSPNQNNINKIQMENIKVQNMMQNQHKSHHHKGISKTPKNRLNTPINQTSPQKMFRNKRSLSVLSNKPLQQTPRIEAKIKTIDLKQQSLKQQNEENIHKLLKRKQQLKKQLICINHDLWLEKKSKKVKNSELNKKEKKNSVKKHKGNKFCKKAEFI